MNSDCADISITDYFSMTVWDSYKRKNSIEKKRLKKYRKKHERKPEKIKKV